MLQTASVREANRQLTLPQFPQNLRLPFPDLESFPSHDTLNRLLAGIEVNQIGNAQFERILWLIRKKKFLRYSASNCRLVAIDGTQKMLREDT